ncbi:MAG TPA: hypothetical protein VNS22_00365 [Geminicoccus sp.]|uniref:hypothetical protein n=1 Tax=Geminicoccus sp. TaxID=2024832 RepID=UPI002D0C88E2|nr:hypothetical protein [Geminicoccus sp.]HWL66818.1 hypothetical protein [Geminicoccus sp.]
MGRIDSLAVMAASLCLPGIVHAASDEAWSRFRDDVAAACLAEAAPLLEDATATVDPFGSPSFGLAVVRGRQRGGDGRAMAVCVYDKQSKAVEVGGAIPEDEDAAVVGRGRDGPGAGGLRRPAEE